MKSIWKGAITFGLVNIPVEMHSASRSQEIKLVMLHKKDLSPIRYARICKEEGKEVPWNEIVKGYEQDGKYVVMTEDEIKKTAMENTRTIDIVNFVKESAIDSVYYDKPYVLEPQKNADKAYDLLLEALKKTGKVGVAKFTLHGREHIGIVKFFDNFIIINQLRFESDLLSFEDLNAPKKVKISPKELEIATQLINHMTSTFKPELFQNQHTKGLKDLIKKKKGIAPKKGTKEAPAKSPKVHDIMSLLKASLEENSKKTKPRQRRAS